MLTAKRAKAIITTAFPEFHGARVELLGAGWDFQVFEVDGRWLFRFPKRETSVAKLNMERKLLSGLGEWVPLPVPNYEYFCESHKSSSRPFAGYRKLPGVGGDTSKMVDRCEVARQLGVFLTRLHTFPVDKAREAGVPEARDMVVRWRAKSREQLQGLDGLRVNLGLLHRYLENETPVSFKCAASLVHNDLWAEHILIDGRSGKVSGIIDWADTVIGDPAIDFACLYTWYGERWLENVLAHYTGELDAEVIPRSRYLAMCVAIHCITLGRDLGRVQWVEAGHTALQWVFATQGKQNGSTQPSPETDRML
ncbi:MAG: phosphotransferase [Chloroflexi bacterium]|nr:phosphotransferase [Chloroflexota bacterium]